MQGEGEAGQRDSCPFAAPLLSALSGLTTFQPDAGTTSSANFQCDGVFS